LTGAQIRELTGDQIRELVSALTGDQEIPIVEKLYSTMLIQIQSKNRLLEQSTFGPASDPETNLCNTPMCIAGHTINIAGADAYKLQERLGFSATAFLIHAVSRPDVPAPRYDSYPNEWALAYIEERAAEEV
jgi:hypothetical protein